MQVETTLQLRHQAHHRLLPTILRRGRVIALLLKALPAEVDAVGNRIKVASISNKGEEEELLPLPLLLLLQLLLRRKEVK